MSLLKHYVELMKLGSVSDMTSRGQFWKPIAINKGSECTFRK
jgi:hypothetical protein